MLIELRLSVEVISAIMCFILLRFMIKPFQITGESRYLGLPLGFGFLGVTYVISGIVFYTVEILGRNTLFVQLMYIQLIARTVALLFLAITYYFSKKPAKNTQHLWKIGLTLLIAAFITSLLILSIVNVTLDVYTIHAVYFRVLCLITVLYICFHTFRSHIEKPDPTTLLIPLGYVFLALNQYSTLLFFLDNSLNAFYSALAFKMIFLSIVLFVSLKAFWNTIKEG
jgi:hypothetical protein